MRDLLTVFLTAAGGAVGYVASDSGLAVVFGCLGGVSADIGLQAYLNTQEFNNNQPR